MQTPTGLLPVERVPLGVPGLDDVLDGGIPRGRATLVVGGTGTGKSVLALQSAVHAVAERGEAVLYIAFEEDVARLAIHARSLAWDLDALAARGLAFLDARPAVEARQSGTFDLSGLLAVAGARAREIGAQRVVFDAIDVVLQLLPAARDVRREIGRLHAWIVDQGFTALITTKPDAGGEVASSSLQYIVDCLIEVDQVVVYGTVERKLRVVKYRGSPFAEGAHPCLIGPDGLAVGYVPGNALDQTAAPDERVSSGVERLDAMLGGGYFRGAGVLVTGAPGTAKTTLAGAFAAASCARGEPTLFVSYDSPSSEIVRNLGSVGVDLGRWRDEGLLEIASPRAGTGSAEFQLLAIRAAAEGHGARCVVVDPLSALSKYGSEASAAGVAERLYAWCKVRGITSVWTSLLDHDHPGLEGSGLQVSTIADTWIHLAYSVRGGERNRTLSIVKSRGTRHSNQVRELLLDAGGITLADVYTAGGEVLIGSLRAEREREVREADREAVAEGERELARLDAATDALQARRRSLEREAVALERERQARAVALARDGRVRSSGRASVHAERDGDAPTRSDATPDPNAASDG